MPMRVATYTRISTDEEHQPYSLEAQDGRLRAFGGPQAKPAPQHAIPCRFAQPSKIGDRSS
jgi:hypothetical protein